MGMYDTIKSSYDLGPGFNKELQTKDLNGFCEQYWIDPVGRLYHVDYSGTQDWVSVPEEKRKNAFDRFKTVPNGKRGRVTHLAITDTIEVYPSKWDAYYVPFPRKQLTFIEGALVVESDLNELKSWRERYLSLKRWVKKHYET